MRAVRYKGVRLLLGAMWTTLAFTPSPALSACGVPGLCTEDEAVQAEIVDVHNVFRKAVQPPAADMLLMSFSADLALSAQAWVENCVLAHGDPGSRSLDGYELGENLFYSSRPNSWTQVITSWYDEEQNYGYPNGSTNGRAVGHYTQVVWNTSYRVGCGVTLCPGSIYFYGCHYYRAGNFLGVPPYTAGAPCAACPDACADDFCTNPCPHVDHFSNCPAMESLGGCRMELVASWCPASCGCLTEIIPVS